MLQDLKGWRLVLFMPLHLATLIGLVLYMDTGLENLVQLYGPAISGTFWTAGVVAILSAVLSAALIRQVLFILPTLVFAVAITVMIQSLKAADYYFPDHLRSLGGMLGSRLVLLLAAVIYLPLLMWSLWALWSQKK